MLKSRGVGRRLNNDEHTWYICGQGSKYTHDSNNEEVS